MTESATSSPSGAAVIPWDRKERRALEAKARLLEARKDFNRAAMAAHRGDPGATSWINTAAAAMEAAHAEAKAAGAECGLAREETE